MRRNLRDLDTVALFCVTLVLGLGACGRHSLVAGEKVGAWELPLRFRGYCSGWLHAGAPDLGPSLSWFCEAELLGHEGSVDVRLELFPQPLTQFFDDERTLGEKTYDACLGLLMLSNTRLVDSASIPSGTGEVRRWCRYMWTGKLPNDDVAMDVFLLCTDEEVVRVEVPWWEVPKPWSREQSLGFLERVKRAKS